jgi:hypothetical protein
VESEGQQITNHSSTPKPPPIYVTAVQNISPLIQLLEKSQKNCKSPSRKMCRIPQLQTKRRKKLQSSIKNMHYSNNPEDIKFAIEKLRYTVTNIWNIKQYRTKLRLSVFFVDLKPIYTAVQNKIRTTQTKKGYCSMCKLPKIWTHQKLLSPQTEMRQRCR